MTDRVAALMAKARESAEAARADLAAGRVNTAGSRAYYAMFHAARAALESKGMDTGKRRHGTIIRQFGLTFVKQGPLPEVHGRSLNRALELRTEGDYGVELLDAASVEAAVKSAEDFVAAVAALLRPA